MYTRYLARYLVMECKKLGHRGSAALPCSPVMLVVPMPARSLLRRRYFGVGTQQRVLVKPIGVSLRVRHVHSTAVRARWVSDDDYKVGADECPSTYTQQRAQDEFCDPDRNLEYWNSRPIVVMQRTAEVGLRFTRWLLSSRLSARQGHADLQATRAAQLRQVLVDLGPAFVKV